jgi:phospholipid/cholesterol/gamma-HCH transport system substrate-binding protein
MRRKIDIEVKAGIFLFLGLFVVMVTILFMGGSKGLFEKQYKLFVDISDVGGLAKGAVVRSGGLVIGKVGEISFSENYENVRITMLVNKSFQNRVREDSTVRFQTQGVLGDKFLEITGGTAGAPALAENSVVPAEAGKDLNAVMADGSNAVQLLKENLANLKVLTGALSKKGQMENIMKDLGETSVNMKEITKQMKASNAMGELGQTMKNLRVVSERVRNGEGTVGALFSDATLYEDLKNLIGGANRNNVLKFFVRQAVKSSDDAKKNGAEPIGPPPPPSSKKGKAPASAK